MMKRIFLILSLLISSASSFASTIFSNDSEDIVYGDVARQLIIVESYLAVLDTTLKNTSFSATALNTFTESGLSVDFAGCTLSDTNQITCLTKIVAVNQNLKVSAYATGFRSKISRLLDNLNNEYPASTVAALNKSDSGNLVFNLIQGKSVEVKFIYRNINPSAISISLFEPLFEFSNIFVKGTFTDIDLRL